MTLSKGDLEVAVDHISFSTLPVGSDGDVLTADSAQTHGIKWAPSTGSGGGQKWAFTVATPGIGAFGNLGATEPSLLATADFIGDGVDDSVAIQAGIDAIRALAAGGTDVLLLILPGYYVVNTTLDTKGIFIRGTEFVQSTVFYTATFLGSAANISTIDNTGSGGTVSLRSIYIQNVTGGKATIKCNLLYELIDVAIATDSMGADRGVVDTDGVGTINHCIISATTPGGTVLHLDGLYSAPAVRIFITNSGFQGGDVTLDSTASAVTNLLFEGNEISQGNFNSTGTSNNNNLHIVNNYIQNGSILNSSQGAYDITVMGNIIENGQINFTIGGGSSTFHNKIVGNHITGVGFTGMVFSACHHSVINDNTIYNAYFHGMTFTDCIDDTVVGNRLRDYGSGAINQDGIRITTSDRLNVQANQLRTTAGKYGIDVISGNDNLVTNNDLKNSGLTTSLNNTATATITAAGNRL